MSTDPNTPTQAPDAEAYAPVVRDPVVFARSILDLQLAQTQIEILQSLAANQRTLVVSGNGVGKTFAAMVGLLWFLSTRPDSVCLSTSRDYTAMTDTAYRQLKQLFATAQGRFLPAKGGTAYEPPRIEMPADDWYYRGVSPSRPGGLEGRHNADCLVVIDEADKPEITADHFESAGTSVTDSTDRMLAIANPPRDEANVVYDKMQSDRWHTVQFSSFDSHNVLVDRNEIDAEYLPGLVELDIIRDDYEEWNQRPWPGYDEARQNHENVDQRWARRRLGIIPPAGARAHRPFYATAVTGAYPPTNEARKRASIRAADLSPSGTAIDVARSGDRTVLASVHGDIPTADDPAEIRLPDTRRPILQIHYSETGMSKPEQEPKLRAHLDGWDDHPGAIDTIGTGSGLASDLTNAYPEMVEFNSGSDAINETTYKDKRAEGLAALGTFFEVGGTILDRRLREELLIAARVTEYDSKYYKSREAEVLQATPKSAIESQLGHSPDHLDAAMMACWAATVDMPGTRGPTVPVRSYRL